MAGTSGQQNKKREMLVLRDGVVVRTRAKLRDFAGDFYHSVLMLSWTRFFAVGTGFFLLINIAFAGLYWLAPGAVANARPGSFLDLLFFSIETLATVGYGEMSPAGTLGHLIAAVEIFIGMFCMALVTGLVFARFSKPTARILFSKHVVIRDFGGRRVLMIRVANQRHNRIVEPNAYLGIVRQETPADGERFFRIYDLPLDRQRNQVFALSWTLIHAIDENSPLFGQDKDAMIRSRTRITASLFGHDETIAAPVHALHEYLAEEVMFDHRFVDIIRDDEDGSRIVDLTLFHDVIPSSSARPTTA